jgi:hypothetical protein
MFEYGFPPPRIVNSAVVLKSQRAPNGAEWYARSWTRRTSRRVIRDRSRYPNRPGYTLKSGSGCRTIGVHLIGKHPGNNIWN